MTEKNRYRLSFGDICMIRLFLLFFHVGKFCVLRQPYQVHGSDGTVSLLGNVDLRNSLHVAVFIVIVVAIDEHYHVGILLDGSRLLDRRALDGVPASALRHG